METIAINPEDFMNPMVLGGGAVMLLGLILAAVFAIILLVKAFRTSLVWGICSIFVPFALLVFVIKYWSDAGGPFLKYLGSSVLAGVGAGVVTMGMPASEIVPPPSGPESGYHSSPFPGVKNMG